MGTNNYQTKNPGDIIAPDDPNQYKTGLTGDVVPRNTSGVPTDVFGSLGSTVYRWLYMFASKIYIGLTASGLSIEESSGDMIFLIGGVEKARLKSTGFTFGSVRARAYVASSAISYSTTSTSLADITNATFSITTNGGDVLIGIKGNGTNACALSLVDDGASGNGGTRSIFLQRDGVDIARWDFGLQGGTGDVTTINTPGSAINYLDTGLAAGTYTYKLTSSGGGTGFTFVLNGVLYGKELL